MQHQEEEQRRPRPAIMSDDDADAYAALIRDAEEMQGGGGDGEEQDYDEEDLYAPPSPSTTARTAPRQDDTLVASRPGVKEGKRPAVMEQEEFEFGQEEMVMTPTDYPSERAAATTVSNPRRHDLDYSYTAPYSDLTSLNLNITRPGYVEAAPISAVNFNGERITLRRRRRVDAFDESAGEAKKNSIALSKLSAEMLEKPYQSILNDIRHDSALRKKQDEADATGVPVADPNEIETTLWTDRYRPKKFTDLLGDERVHRSALLWLKEWDQCVFKGSAKNSAAAEAKRERRKKRSREAKSENYFAGANDEERAPDAFGRPQEKILLLCGPPGLGKTTLAYVLARQAGYQVLEVNASDDRTAKIVTDRIRNALESTSLSMGGKKNNGTSKPTCVVIDEIDGAGGGGEQSFVKTLVKLVIEGSSTKKHRGKGKKDRPLLRPIICICNDLYAPALRPLRPLARIIRFTPPTNLMLVKRLRTICDEEGLGADSKNLTMLTEIAEGDLRSCLNTLQFIKRRSTVVDEHAIKSTTVGMKDTGTSVSTVWDRLFKKPPRKKGGAGGDSDEKFVNRLVKDVQTCGEYDKISQGCFENYLATKSTSDAWSRIIEVHDWMFLYDRLEGRLRSDRDYELLSYVPYTFIAWYKLFSSHTAKPIEFPKADYEAYLKRTAHQEIADAFTLGLPYTLRNMFTATNIAAELLPFINRIISPDLKPINSQLIKTEERLVMLKLVHHMLKMKLGFVQDRNEEGQLSYKLDPPIDVFVHYDGKRATDLAPSRYAVRHLISREMETEIIRRTEGDGLSTTAKDIIAAYKMKSAVVVKEDVKEAVDFFGRAIVVKISTAEEEANLPEPPRKKQRAVYKFHEGFSNAVRVTKRIADFL